MRNVGDTFTRAFVTGAGWSAGWRVGEMFIDGIVTIISDNTKSQKSSAILPPLPSINNIPRLQVPQHLMDHNYGEVSVVYDLPIPADGRIIITLYRSSALPEKLLNNHIYVRFARQHPVAVSIHLVDAMGFCNYQNSRQQSNIQLFDSPVDQDIIESQISEECFTKLELYRHNFLGIYGLCKGGALETPEIQKLIYKNQYNCCDIVWQNQTRNRTEDANLGPPMYEYKR